MILLVSAPFDAGSGLRTAFFPHPQAYCALNGRYVMPRPEGQRCLLISSGGQTVARMRNGVQMARFPSALPGGSRHTQVMTALGAFSHLE